MSSEEPAAMDATMSTMPTIEYGLAAAGEPQPPQPPPQADEEKPAEAYAPLDPTAAQLNPAQPPEAAATPDPTSTDVKMEPAPLTEYERLWNIVNINPSDFSTWTTLILETERLDDISKIRVVYDKFLSEFPLCYGYWKKYADHETRHGNTDKTVEVYERAVASVAYSVDMWTHYCVFTMGRTTDAEEVRRTCMSLSYMIH